MFRSNFERARSASCFLIIGSTSLHELKVPLAVILRNVSNFFNTLKDKKFHVLEILKILSRITTKCILIVRLRVILESVSSIFNT